MLSFDRRPCKIGLSTWKRSGDAMAIPFSGIMLEREELNSLLGDGGAWSCWFRERLGDLPAPARWTKNVRGFSVAQRFRDTHVTIYWLAEPEPTRLIGRITHLHLTPQRAGQTELSLTLHCCADISPMKHIDPRADVALDIGARDERTVLTRPRLHSVPVSPLSQRASS